MALRLANVLSKLESERTIEIPIALRFAERFLGSRVLEVGNVLGYYARWPEHWEIIDRYEVMAGVRNEDIVTVEPIPKFAAVISVSTLEHVGWDEPDPDPSRFLRAVGNCCRFLRPGGSALITLPLRYNPAVDAWVKSGASEGFELGYCAPIGARGLWAQVDGETAWRSLRGIVVATYQAT
jgi:SAM-dependent methyltransferase